MIRKIATVVACAMLAVAPLAASAQIAAGTQLTGTIDRELSSASAQVGDYFTISGVHSENHDVDEATIYGHVAEVVRAGQGRTGKISLAYDKVRLASGEVYSLAGTGTVSAQFDTKNNTVKEAGGAVAGMVVGNILGKAIGTNLGGLLGGGAGYELAKNNRENVSIAKDSAVVVEINRPLRQTR
jgi:hypothetical protein